MSRRAFTITAVVGAAFMLLWACTAILLTGLTHGWDRYLDHANINGRNCHRIAAKTWRCP